METPGSPACDREATHLSAGVVGMALCSTSIVSCAWAIYHLLRKVASVRRKLFWSQFLALSLADICGTISFMIRLSTQLIAQMPVAVEVFITFGLFWSLFLELQIAAGINWGLSERAPSAGLWLLIPLSALLAMGLGVFDAWLYSIGEKGTLGHSLLWCSGFLVFGLLTPVFYIHAWLKAKAAPSVVRRRIVLRGMTYTFNFCISVLPNFILDALILFGVVTLDRPRGCELVERHIGIVAWADLITLYLYCLNGALNVATYLVWMVIDARSREQSALSNASITALEDDLCISVYFDLSDPDIADAQRDVADAIAAAKQVRDLSGSMHSTLTKLGDASASSVMSSTLLAHGSTSTSTLLVV